MALFGLTLKIGTYELPLGRWGEEADVEFDHRLIENQRRHKWELKGIVTADNVAAYVAALTAFRSAADTQGQDVEVLWDGETVASLTAAQCADGPMVKKFKLPNSADKFATVQPVEISIEGVEETATGDTLTDQHWISYRTDSEGVQVISVRGQFRTKKGVSAETVMTGKLPAIPSGYARQTREIEYDDQDRDCKYRVEDKQKLSGEIPGDDNAEVSTETTIDQQGRKHTTISGFYTGDDALANVETHRPSSIRLQRESIRQNLVTGRVDFSFEYIDMASGDYLSWQSTVSKSGGGQVKDVILLAGTTPFIISGAHNVHKVEYRGSAEAKLVYPDAADTPYGDNHLAEPVSIERDDPEPNVKRTTWRYSYIFETDPGGPIILPRPN